MKRYKKSLYLIPMVLLVVGGLVLGLRIDAVVSGTDTYEQLRKLEHAFVIIQRQYVEEADPADLVEHAIEGMLGGLDPHSVYISAEENAEVQESYQGAFGGIGVQFEMLHDTIHVISTISDGPSESVGIQAGDRIIAIDDSSAVGFTNLQVQKHLKGDIGTEVEVTIQRLGVKEPLDFMITRGRIPLTSIDTAYMIDDQTGYIRIGRFAMTTHEEFAEALAELESEGMARLVLDLRYNGGGIMEAAERIVDEMIGGGKTIVYTEGRNPQFNKVVRSSDGGEFEEGSVIVLVNEFSASASEIVAGALQDHDRALIVGRRTFGKGLVQQQFPLPDRSVLQMTISRYYTPSGRLIQTPYEKGNVEDYYEHKSLAESATFDVRDYIDSVPDSLKFRTAQNRVVFGGGGILPDYIVPLDTLNSPVASTVINNRLDFQFVREWFDENEKSFRDAWGDRRQEFIRTFEVDEALWDSFWTFAESKGVQVTTDSAAVSVDDDVFAAADVEENRATFEARIKALLARQLYGSGVWYPIINQIDNELDQALRLWDRASELAAYHQK